MTTPISPGPTGPELLALELAARHQGTGLVAGDLEGCWQLTQVWPKGQSRPARFSGAALRAVGARLELSLVAGSLVLSNVVSLASLELRFRGRAQLVGRRPLLAFHFDQVELNLAGKQMFCIPPPQPSSSRQQPFFALIARHPDGWLAARGRGGGLALWTKVHPAPIG